jgi:hypothetical protein
LSGTQLAEALTGRLLFTYATSIDRRNDAGWAVEGIGTSGLSYSNGQFDLRNDRDQQDREEKT